MGDVQYHATDRSAWRISDSQWGCHLKEGTSLGEGKAQTFPGQEIEQRYGRPVLPSRKGNVAKPAALPMGA